MKVSKCILESALIFQAKNDVRYYLNGICFKKDGRVCSTDGFRLFVGGKHSGELEDDLIVSIGKSPTKKYDHAIIDLDNGVASYFDDSEVKVGIQMCKVINGRFPDVDRVIPSESAPCEKIGFNAGFLGDVDKAAKLFNPRFNSVLFELNGNKNGSVAKFKSPFGDEGLVVVMPMRIE